MARAIGIDLDMTNSWVAILEAGELQVGRSAKWLKMQLGGEVVATGVSDPWEGEQQPDVLADARALVQSL